MRNYREGIFSVHSTLAVRKIPAREYVHRYASISPIARRSRWSFAVNVPVESLAIRGGRTVLAVLAQRPGDLGQEGEAYRLGASAVTHDSRNSCVGDGGSGLPKCP